MGDMDAWGAADRKRAYGYIRVSTKQQAGEDRMGQEAQRQAITEYAERNGYEVVKWFNDEISGVKEDRPQLNGILYTDLAKRDGVEAVIAFKSDRIARDIKLYFYYLSLLDKKGIKLISVNEQFENVPDGVASLIRAIMMFVAEQERNNITMRTKSGRKIKAEFGGYSGGKPPYGYVAHDKRLVVVPEEAALVRDVFELREFYPMREVAEIINGYGYRTRKDGLFCTSHVQSILENRKMYEGFYKYGKDGEWVKGQHEPILGDEGKKWEQYSKKVSVPDSTWFYRRPEFHAPDLNENAPNQESVSEPDKAVSGEAENDTVCDTVCDTTQDIIQPEPPRPATFVGGVFGA